METLRLMPPPGACDTHMHVYEERFGRRPNATFLPPHASAADYALVQQGLGLSRVVVVQANCYGDDNRGLLEAMRFFGDRARGVAIVSPHIKDAELCTLHAAGVRGVRFHMLPGGALQWPDLDAVVARVQPLGWHVQIQLDGNELLKHEAQLSVLPLHIVIDHVGKFLHPGPPQPHEEAFKCLLRLLDGERFWVKLSAPYESSRLGAPHYEDVAILARALVRHRPDRCLWASNWPHATCEPRPSDVAMLNLLLDWVDDAAVREKILVSNPATLYDFASPIVLCH